MPANCQTTHASATQSQPKPSDRRVSAMTEKTRLVMARPVHHHGATAAALHPSIVAAAVETARKKPAALKACESTT